MLDFSDFIFININEVIIKGIIGINKFDSEAIDCFKYELLFQQDNCKKIIINSTIGSFDRNGD